MAGGYMGKLLWVDLTQGKTWDEPLDTQDCKDYLGGYGLGAKIIFERQPAGVDPLAPEALLGVLTGPLTGSPAIEGNRFVVVCKSPLTGTWGDANCGGTFGPALKWAGYDGVFFVGKAAKPTVLTIIDGKPELVDGSDVWGKDVTDTEDTLKARYGRGTEVASIGPAGENLSLIAAVMNDYGRAAGRSGVGAVMGSKLVKAIVAKGKAVIPLADKAKADALRRDYMKRHDGAYDLFVKYGTIGITGGSAMSGDSPVKNWGGSGLHDFPQGAESFRDEVVIKWQDRKYGCWHCTMACGGHMSTKPEDGEYAGVKTHKVEYETAASFGTMTLSDNFPALIKQNDLCNRFGFDTIGAGTTIAFAVECYENGIITKADTGGLELKWGNHSDHTKLLELMGRREGFGAVLADGSARAAKAIGKGAEQFVMAVQGQELPMHDPRFEPGLATTYVMDATPGRHTQGGEMNPPVGLEVGKWDRYQYEGKGDIHRKLSALMHVVNSAGTCMFAYLSYPFSYVPDFLAAVTGNEYSIEECYLVGERIANIRHAFNIREGLNPLEFSFPNRMMGVPPLEHGNVRGVTVDYKQQWKDYFEAMDWDQQTAKPSAKRLEALGLGYVAKALGSV